MRSAVSLRFMFLVALALCSLNVYVEWESACSSPNPALESWSLNLPTRHSMIPLPELTSSNKTVQCKEGLIPIYDVLADSNFVFQKRKIPRIIHLTSKSRCLHPELATCVEKWKLKGYSLFFHDDEAMDKILYRDWPEFPEFKYVLKCVLYGGAAKADIWRELLLWEYGGIFADVDSYPHHEKFNETTITSEDDAFFVIDQINAPSQWFMAASPRHPMIYLNIRIIIHNIINLEDVGMLRIISTIGPFVVADGFDKFLGPLKDKVPNPLAPGVYKGAYGRSVTLVGSANNVSEYIERSIYNEKGREESEEKHKVFETMGMMHHSRLGHNSEMNRQNESCLWRMWQNEVKETVLWKPTW